MLLTKGEHRFKVKTIQHNLEQSVHVVEYIVRFAGENRTFRCVSLEKQVTLGNHTCSRSNVTVTECNGHCASRSM